MKKLKDWKTTGFASIIGLQQLFAAMGIEVPENWEKMLMIGAVILLYISGDPKAADFVKSAAAKEEAKLYEEVGRNIVKDKPELKPKLKQ